MTLVAMKAFASAMALVGIFAPTAIAYGTLSPYVTVESPVTQQVSSTVVGGNTIVSYSVCSVIHQTDCSLSVATALTDYQHPPTVVPTVPGAASSVSVHQSQPTAPGAPPSSAGPEQPGNPTGGVPVSLPTEPGYSAPPVSQPAGTEPGVPAPPPASQTAVSPPGVTASEAVPSGQQTLTGDYESDHPTGGTGSSAHASGTNTGHTGHTGPSGSYTATGTSLKPIVTGSTIVPGPEATATGAAVGLNAIPAITLGLAGMLVAYIL